MTRYITHNHLVPALPTHSGEVLKEEIAARGLTQKELAEQMGRSTQIVNYDYQGPERHFRGNCDGFRARLSGYTRGVLAEYGFGISVGFRASSRTYTEEGQLIRTNYQRFIPQ